MLARLILSHAAVRHVNQHALLVLVPAHHYHTPTGQCKVAKLNFINECLFLEHARAVAREAVAREAVG